MIYIASDHAGFDFKENLKSYISNFEKTEDLGSFHYERSDDFVDYAKKLSKKVRENNSKGILICESGHGMDIVANKFKGIYSAVCWNEKLAVHAVKDNNINVICIPAGFIKLSTAKKVIRVFLTEKFSKKKRYIRRIRKIKALEKRNFK